MTDYKKNRKGIAERFSKTKNNPYKTITDLNLEYESEEGVIRLIKNIKTYLGDIYTKEKFIKEFACDKEVFKESEYCITSQSNSGDIPTNESKYNCITNHYKDKEVSKYSDRIQVVKNPDKDLVWQFWSNNRWRQYTINKNGVNEFMGKWECVGDSNFRITADDGDVYNSTNQAWTKKNNPTIPYSSNSCQPIKDDNVKNKFEDNSKLLSYPYDKKYRYLKINNQWYAKNITNDKIFNLTACGKYQISIDNLEKQYPESKPLENYGPK